MKTVPTNGAFRTARRLAFALFFASVAFAQDATSASQPRRDPEVVRIGRATQETRAKVLTGHGLGTGTADLLAFLQSGFGADALARGFPQQPAVKSEVVNAAIQELGFAQDPAAVPVLASILAGDPPQGVLAIANADAERLSLSTRDAARETYLKYGRFNALVALGLIGDPSALPAVREAVAREEGYSFAIEGCTTLALLGDGSALAAVAPYAEDPASDQIVRAFESVFYATGRNYGLTTNSSVARRREAATQFAQWRQANGAAFVPDRADVLRRRAAGMAEEQIPVSSLRGALRAARQFGDFDLRWSARQYLQRLGRGAAPDLKAIAEDPLEDIDIRQAAMEWFAAADPRDARKTMRRLADKDENDAVRTTAARLEKDISETLAQGGARP